MAVAVSKTHAVMILVLALLTLCVFAPSLRCQFIWDDNAHVTRPELRSLSGLYRIWFDVGATQQYYPLLHTTFWIEQELFGEKAWAYHLINLLEHAGAACLLYVILLKLRVPGALLASVLFAVHPVQVESVAWITEQKNTLSALFYLGAMLTYLHFDSSRRQKLYWLAAVLFVLGLLTKTVTATLPAALLVVFWWQHGKLSWRRDVLPLLPWLLLGAAAGLFTAWVERNLIGAEGTAFELTLIQRSLLAGRVIWFYLAKLVWPANLLFIYPRWNIDPGQSWQWLFPAAAAAVTVGFWLARCRSRGPLACWLFYVGTLFPVLGFVNVFPFIYSYVADHFQYLASIGTFVLFAAGGATFTLHWTAPARKIAATLATAVVAALAAITWQQIPIYRDTATLFAHTLAGNPTCWMAYNNLGFEKMQQGDIARAKNLVQQSLDLYPNNPAALVNMGQLAEKSADLSEAIHWYQLAIDAKPGYFLAHNSLGQALDLSGHPELAQSYYQDAIRLRPDYAPALSNLATAFGELGHSQQAIDEFNVALQLDPTSAQTHHNIAFLLAGMGRVDEAIQHYRDALRLRPNFPEAHFNWANAVTAQHPQQAIEHYQAAIAQRADYAEAYANLATTYAQIGDRNQALAAMQTAVDLAREQHNEPLVRQLEPYLRTYKSP